MPAKPVAREPSQGKKMQAIKPYALPLAGGCLSVAALGMIAVQRKRRQAKAEALVARAELVLSPRFSKLSPSMRAYNWNCYKWAAVNGPEDALRSFSITLVLRPSQDLLSWAYTPFLSKQASYCVEIELLARGETRPSRGTAAGGSSGGPGHSVSSSLFGLNLCVIKRREVSDFKKKRPAMLNRMLEAKVHVPGHQAYEGCSHGLDVVLNAIPPEILERLDLFAFSGGRLTLCGDLVETDDYMRKLASCSLAMADALLSFVPSAEQASQLAKREAAAAKEEKAVAARARAARESGEAQDRLVELEQSCSLRTRRMRRENLSAAR